MQPWRKTLSKQQKELRSGLVKDYPGFSSDTVSVLTIKVAAKVMIASWYAYHLPVSKYQPIKRDVRHFVYLNALYFQNPLNKPGFSTLPDVPVCQKQMSMCRSRVRRPAANALMVCCTIKECLTRWMLRLPDDKPAHVNYWSKGYILLYVWAGRRHCCSAEVGRCRRTWWGKKGQRAKRKISTRQILPFALCLLPFALLLTYSGTHTTAHHPRSPPGRRG